MSKTKMPWWCGRSAYAARTFPIPVTLWWNVCREMKAVVVTVIKQALFKKCPEISNLLVSQYCSGRFVFSPHWHIGAETKWPPFSRLLFHTHFLVVFWGTSQWNFFLRVQLKYYSIGSDNGMVPVRRQVIIWTNDDYFTDVYMRQSASMS